MLLIYVPDCGILLHRKLGFYAIKWVMAMYKIKEGFIIREIGNRIMAVPVGTRTTEIHGMIALSESAKLLWDALRDGATVDCLVKILIDNYEVEESVAIDDVNNFLDKLKEQGALV